MLQSLPVRQFDGRKHAEGEILLRLILGGHAGA